MSTQGKSIVGLNLLGAELRDRRKRLGYTLQQLSEVTSINVGQLSRFENGDMKRISRNLQKLIDRLQTWEASASPVQSPDVVNRFAAILRRSDRHAAAAAALVDALERLM